MFSNTDKLPILIAEDDPDDQLLLADALKIYGGALDLHVVEDGEELMEYLHRRDPAHPKPKLVFLDLNMPRKDGREALKEIKQHKNLRDIPVIVWTTSTRKEDVRLCSSLGADSFMTKADDFDELKAAASHVIEKWLHLHCDDTGSACIPVRSILEEVSAPADP